MSEPVLRRLREGREGKDECEWFPAFHPRLMPYLAAQDELGNTAIKPGPLIPASPLDSLPQQGKYWLSEAGLRYSLAQTFTFVNLTEVMPGDNALGSYTLDFAGTWAVFNAPNAGTAGWISAQIEAQVGLGASGKAQDGLRAIAGSINLAPGSFGDRRVLAIAFHDVDIVDRLHKVARHDWEHSRPLDLTDEGLFMDLEEHGHGGVEKLVLRADHEHAKQQEK